MDEAILTLNNNFSLILTKLLLIFISKDTWSGNFSLSTYLFTIYDINYIITKVSYCNYLSVYVRNLVDV